MNKEINDKLASIKEKLGKSEGKAVEKGESNKSKKEENGVKVDRRHFNKRTPGSGRKKMSDELKIKTFRQTLDEFCDEEDEITITDRKTNIAKRVKVKKFRVWVEALYKQVKAGNTSAIHEFGDRVLGKAPQPLKGDENDDTPIRIGLDITSVLEKEYDEDD